MIAAISASRSDGNSSFGALSKYLTMGRSLETGEQIMRGPVLLSQNLISLDTAANEMRLVAAAKGGVKEPAVHFQIAWPHGEKPTKEQWVAAARKCLGVLELSEHQFIIAAHNDKEHFHVHVMANRIHPETGEVNSLSFSKLKLDRAMRELEHAQGWSPTPGPYKWDRELGQAVRDVTKNPDRQPSGKKIEVYQDVESVKNFAARIPASDIRWELDKPNPTWKRIHHVLATHDLVLERGEKGGYTVRASKSDIRVKASDVFRKSFAGKQNREELERKLGPFQERVPSDRPAWVVHIEQASGKLPRGYYADILDKMCAEPDLGPFEQPDHVITMDMTPEQCVVAMGARTNLFAGMSLRPEQLAPDQRPLHPPGKSGRGDERKPGSRDERKEQRQAERQALVADFKRAKAVARNESAAESVSARERRAELRTELSEKKKAIRQEPVTWQVKRSELSVATAIYLHKKQELETQLRAERARKPPLTYQVWVEEQAEKGDARAVVQLRGWRYQENRVVKALERATESEGKRAGGSIATPDSSPRIPYAADLANARLRELAAQEQYAALLKGIRWEANRMTGTVSYKIDGELRLMDRGKSITVLDNDAAATRLALEMAIQKYGIHLDVKGTEEWKRQLLQAAVRQERNLVFTDVDLQRRYEALKAPVKAKALAKSRAPKRDGGMER